MSIALPGSSVFTPMADFAGQASSNERFDAASGLLSGAGVMDPMTGALISAGSNVLGKALSPSSAGPSRADSGGMFSFGFDNSGWTVATGSSKAEAARGLELPSWLLLGVAALAAVVWVRSKNR